MAAKRKLSVRKCLVRTKDITGAANGADEFVREAAIDLGPQTAHVGFDDVGAGIEFEIPHFLQKHLARHDPPRMAHEELEQLEFLMLHFYDTPVARHRAGD